LRIEDKGGVALQDGRKAGNEGGKEGHGEGDGKEVRFGGMGESIGSKHHRDRLQDNVDVASTTRARTVGHNP
jgi:hypothetical protein